MGRAGSRSTSTPHDGRPGAAPADPDRRQSDRGAGWRTRDLRQRRPRRHHSLQPDRQRPDTDRDPTLGRRRGVRRRRRRGQAGTRGDDGRPLRRTVAEDPDASPDEGFRHSRTAPLVTISECGFRDPVIVRGRTFVVHEDMTGPPGHSISAKRAECDGTAVARAAERTGRPGWDCWTVAVADRSRADMEREVPP